jgi:hypothetical protein
VITRMWVEGQTIRDNVGRRDRGEPDAPPVVVARGAEIVRCFAVEIRGPSRVVYAPETPMQNGVTLWIETTAPVHTA